MQEYNQIEITHRHKGHLYVPGFSSVQREIAAVKECNEVSKIHCPRRCQYRYGQCL